ncbi:MAG: hypothetical protein ACI4MJ_06075, partial [Aristaeellaceae bacterium]
RGETPAQVWAAAQRNTFKPQKGIGKTVSFQADDAVRPRWKRQVPGIATGTTPHPPSLRSATFPRREGFLRDMLRGEACK